MAAEAELSEEKAQRAMIDVARLADENSLQTRQVYLFGRQACDLLWNSGEVDRYQLTSTSASIET